MVDFYQNFVAFSEYLDINGIEWGRRSLTTTPILRALYLLDDCWNFVGKQNYSDYSNWPSNLNSMNFEVMQTGFGTKKLALVSIGIGIHYYVDEDLGSRDHNVAESMDF